MLRILNRAIVILSSLQLALASFAVLFILVLVGTFAQTQHGIFYVQELYFKSWFLFVDVAGIAIPYFPGGMLAGTILVINLSLSTVFHLKWTWRRSGLILLHIGLIILLAGGGLTSCIAEESQVYLEEGQSTFYSENLRDVELVVIDALRPDFDYIITIPQSRLQEGQVIQDDALPFDIAVQGFFPNVQVSEIRQTGGSPVASAGIGKDLGLIEIPVFTQDDQRNNPAALIRCAGDSYLVALDINGLQQVVMNDRPYYIQLRPKRYYFPFLMTLKTFTQDYYPGSTIPKAYSSLVTLKPFDQGTERDVLIYMNHPLRSHFYTFFQASFGEERPSSVLQVVFNPSWLLPYIACVIIALGMGLHFVLHLLGVLKRRRSIKS